MAFIRNSNVDKVEIVSVVHVESVTGLGEENDPVRKIDEYYSMDGTLLARRDGWLEDLPLAVPSETEMTEKERGDRLEGVVDRMAEKLSNCMLLVLPVRELCLQIEACGASEELTRASTMACDILHKLMDALEMKQLPPGAK